MTNLSANVAEMEIDYAALRADLAEAEKALVAMPDLSLGFDGGNIAVVHFFDQTAEPNRLSLLSLLDQEIQSVKDGGQASSDLDAYMNEFRRLANACEEALVSLPRDTP